MAKAKKTTRKSTAAPRGSRETDVKMVQRHTEFQEVDVEASQAEGPEPGTGPNPFREGTAQWAAHENFARIAKGLPATNNINDPNPIVMKNKNKAFQEVDYKNSPSARGND